MGSVRIRIDGGCHCGAITYEAEVDPRRVVICHCTDCQTFSGAPYRVSVSVLRKHFRLSGEPRYYKKRPDGPGANAFCPTCGAAMFSHRADRDFIFLRTGSVRQRAELVPTLQGFCRSAMPWARDLSGIAKAETP
jgi:hypothetical protein